MIHILGEMAKALTGARDEVSDNAPRITTLTIPKDKIREVIGSGGKVIREITETTGAKIDIDDDGTIKVAACRRQCRAGRHRLDPRDRRRAGTRRHLQRQGGQDRRFWRFCEFPRFARRARPYQ